MSTDTAVIERTNIVIRRETKEVPVKFVHTIKNSDSVAWRQITEILGNSLSNSGFPQPHEISRSLAEPKISKLPIQVAPGVIVGTDEYKQRYGNIDLEKYKREMSPEVFQVFVRHIGRISGMADLKLADIVVALE